MKSVGKVRKFHNSFISVKNTGRNHYKGLINKNIIQLTMNVKRKDKIIMSNAFFIFNFFLYFFLF